MRVFAVIAAALLVSATAYGQGSDDLARKQAFEKQATEQQAAVASARVALERTVKGAPYSADVITETSQTLADGNHISNKTTGHVFRDGDGRTRREQDRDFTVMTANGPVSGRTTSISIVDPVAGVSYTLDPEHRIAWKTSAGTADALFFKIQMSMVEEQAKLEAERKASAEGAPRPAVAPSAAGARGRGAAAGVTAPRRTGGNPKETPLEHKTIEGLAVDGHTNTMTIPAGQIGNEQPIIVTSEEWTSPDLKVLVLTHHSDPRTGDSTYRLTNIIRAEPDRSLFMVPPDYTVKENSIRKIEPSRDR